jgi:acyl-CoA thioester hydrolase
MSDDPSAASGPLAPSAAPTSPPPGFHAPGQRATPITIVQTVNWSDLDALRHVNNAHYVRWAENGRFVYFDVVGLNRAHETRGIGPILARTEFDYLAPVTWPDDVWVATRTAVLGRTSFTLETSMWSAAQARMVGRGRFVIVTVDYGAGGRPTLVPEDVRAAMVALEGAAMATKPASAPTPGV